MRAVPAEKVDPEPARGVPEGFARRCLTGAGRGTERPDAVWAEAAHAGTAVAVQTAEQLFVWRQEAARVLGVRRWNDVPVVVLGNGKKPVQIVQFGSRRAGLGDLFLV